MPLITNADILLDKRAIKTENYKEYFSEDETNMYLIEETHTQVNFSLKKYPFTGERKTVKSELVDFDNRKIENEVEQDLDQKSSIQIHSDIKSEDEDFINSQYFISHEEIDLKPEDDVEESDTQVSVIEKKGLGQNNKRVATHKTVELNNNNRAYEKAGKPHLKNDMIETPVEKRFKNHKLRHKPKDQIIHRCPDCPYQSTYKNHLKRHSLRHKKPDEIVWYRCTECPFKSIRKENFKRHAIVHNETRQNEIFKCAHCVFETIHKSVLKIHFMKHANPDQLKWYRCEQCPYKTYLNCNFKRHQIKHQDDDGPGWCKCPECPFKTTDKYHFVRHTKNHKAADQTDWSQCPECSYRTPRRDLLKAHQNAAH